MGKILYILTLLFLVVSGIQPVERFTWWLEISWVLVGLAAVALIWWKRIEMTASLKIAMFIHAVILIYGGWYTYEQVPLGEWMRHAFDFQRNHYDRLGHLAQGFFPAILAREIIVRNHATKNRFWTELFVFACCMAFTGIFEIIEFMSAVCFGDASAAYLGTQGDEWDAQKDMIMCGIGCLLSIATWGSFHYRQLARMTRPAGRQVTPD